MNNYYFTGLFFFFAPTILANNNLDQLSNRTVLKNPYQVQSILKQHGFKKVTFITQDNIKLCGLFLDQSKKTKIKGTIIFEAGFYPGTKEGIATFYALLADQPYNFLFFDARGHNESSGTFLTYRNLKEYGHHEYLDIVAALNFIQEFNQTNNLNPNIILHGICSGAFHSIKACKQQSAQNNNIKGIIFDSGWNKLTEIVEPTMIAKLHDSLKDSYLSFLEQPLCLFFSYLYHLFFKTKHELVFGIDDDVAALNCPIFFIHSINDRYAPIQPAQQLAQKAQHPTTWWIDTSNHATCHLQDPTEYAKKIKDFCWKYLDSPLTLQAV